jgi:hypothetical protein
MCKGRAVNGPCTATHSGLLCFPKVGNECLPESIVNIDQCYKGVRKVADKARLIKRAYVF